MSGRYAAGTTVSSISSRDEIERTLSRFGATAFAYYRDDNTQTVAIAFEIANRRIRMTMKLPDREQFRFHSRGVRAESAIEAMWEKETRRYWRTLALGIKAKLAMVEDGISTVEREFFADTVMPNGQTVYEAVSPLVIESLSEGTMQPMFQLSAGSE